MLTSLAIPIAIVMYVGLIPLLRFTHEFQSDSSTSSEHCHTLSSALQSVRTAAEKVELLRSRLERERVVLGEKEEVSHHPSEPSR